MGTSETSETSESSESSEGEPLYNSSLVEICRRIRRAEKQQKGATWVVTLSTASSRKRLMPLPPPPPFQAAVFVHVAQLLIDLRDPLPGMAPCNPYVGPWRVSHKADGWRAAAGKGDNA